MQWNVLLKVLRIPVARKKVSGSFWLFEYEGCVTAVLVSASIPLHAFSF